MITDAMMQRFLVKTRGQAMREGTRYAREARVQPFVGSRESVSTVVRGQTGEFDVALWSEDAALAHRCTCPSWRDPCKHEVAAVIALRQGLALVRSQDEERGSTGDASDGQDARRRAVEERLLAGRREKLYVSLATPPRLVVKSASGFAYTVSCRGGAEGPHSCDCPDFEANRLHTCKHVERVRLHLRRGSRIPPAHRRAAATPRVYLHFGEVVEPRLFGAPAGRGAQLVRVAFDAQGLPIRPMAADDRELLRWLSALGPQVESEALDWLQSRVDRRPAIEPEEARRALERLTTNGLRPYDYQKEGALFLATSGRALLADEMGLGKTVQAILAATLLRTAAAPARHVTIVCPASLRGGWQDEIQRWLGESASLLDGPAIERGRTIRARAPWLITHFEQVRSDFAHHRDVPPDLLIVDEAQRAKGLATRTARVLKAISSRYLFALTGTPLENRLEEAYAIAQLIDQRLLPPLWQIERDHFVRDAGGRRVVMYRNLESMRSRLAPAFLRRRKEEVALELPKLLRSVVKVPLHDAVCATYNDAMRQVAMIASRKRILPADMDRILRLLVIARRCCNGPHMLGLAVDDRKVAKLRELEDALRDLCLGERRKAVIFSEWTDMTDRVEALCRRLSLPVFHLHGSVPVRQRPSLIRAFTETKGPAAFVSTDSGGLGLNLQAADVVVNLDVPWNPARLEQRIARAHRIGSRRPVQVLLLVTEEVVEERILALHDTKQNALRNIWAATGEDAIAAPGGSGAFFQMVRALIEDHPPAGARGLASNGVEMGPSEPDAAEPPAAVTSLPMEGPAASIEAAIREAPAASVSAVTRGSLDGASLAADGQAPRHAGAPEHAVDPAVLATAIAAVAPALPAEHRRSLASVLRALAGALEGGGAPS